MFYKSVNLLKNIFIVSIVSYNYIIIVFIVYERLEKMHLHFKPPKTVLKRL